MQSGKLNLKKNDIETLFNCMKYKNNMQYGHTQISVLAFKVPFAITRILYAMHVKYLHIIIVTPCFV